MFKLDLEKAERKEESEVTQSGLTLWDPMVCSLSASSVHGIFQARVLEWVAISLSRGSSWPRIEPRSPAFQADTLLSEQPGKHRKGRGTRNQMASILLDHIKSKRIPEKHILLLHWLCYNLELCGSQQTGRVFNRWKYQTTLPASEKPVWRSRSNN